MPRVSVIIPTYNRAGLIRQTIDSIWAQTVCDYEIVVVDDGSTDSTMAVLSGLGRALMLRRIEHSGQSAARNAALEIASGDLVAFLDSDDSWEPQFLEKMIRALDASPRLGFVYCDYSTFGENGVIREKDTTVDHKIEGRLFAPLLESCFISMGTVLIRRECLRHVGGFDTDLSSSEDWDMWLRLALQYDAGYVDEPLVRIRVSEHSPSRIPTNVYPLNLRVLAKLKREFPAETLPLDPLIRGQIARSHLALARHFGRRHKPLPLIKHLGLMLAARYL
jgi:glycosyltransferase involved in cell wall biosynthesis